MIESNNIRYLGRDEIDDDRWNECINQSFNGMVYAYTWFLDLVADDWDGMVEGEYESVFPLPQRTKFGVQYIYQPFFTQQLGLFSRNRISEEAIFKFISLIPDKFKYTELNLNTHNRIEVTGPAYFFQPQLNHELDLINSYATISSSYSKNLKRNLKKAEKNQLTLIKNIRPELIIDLFRESRGKEFRHLGEKEYMVLKRLIYSGMYKGRIRIYGAYSDHNELLAGAVFLVSNKKAIFIFSGMNDEGREKGGMPFLIDQFIRAHANSHLTFDFDGSNDENLARFYKSFGSKECTYQRITINKLPPLHNFFFRIYKALFR